MPIRVKCEKCKKTLSVKDHLAGKKIKCPLCQGVVAVPAASSATEPPKPGTPGPAKKPGPAAAKKPAAGTKPAIKSKPAAGKPETNGTPGPNGEKTNGNGKAHPPAPAPVELPPENVEEEALAALADEPPPPEETQAPQTIDFKCSWCDEDVKLPIELGGKQAQCPNPECKRIIKVPMPKAPEKKDWRKMDRRGPAAAAINQPEALENAWGTEEATQARQGSLAQAGIGVPDKPPIGVFGWMRRGLYTLLAIGLLLGISVGGYKLSRKNVEHRTVADIEHLLDSKPPKIGDHLLKAETHRTLALYHLYGGDAKFYRAHKDFEAARGYCIVDESPSPEKPFLNEQLFLIELALSEIEVAAEPEDLLIYQKKRIEWKDLNLTQTLQKIQTQQLQVIALRELAVRLDERKKKEFAVGLAVSFSAEDPITKKRPLAYRQQIALMYWADQIDKLEPKVEEPKLAELKELDESDIRVGFAEGYARKAKYEDALKLAAFPGPEWDRLDAHIGIASVAWQNKNKEVAADALAKAMTIADKADAKPWHWFELGRLAARLDDKDAVKKCIDKLPPPFKLRVQLEVVLAQCDRSTTPVDRVILDDLEAATENDRITLALGWTAVARQQARTGANSLKIFDQYKALGSLKSEDYDLIRPMVEIGSFQGTLSK